MSARKEKIILHIDTDEQYIEAVQRFSVRENIKVISAGNGQEGLDVARDILPDLVIIKKEAPMLDALSFSVLFKQSKRTAAIPVLVICSGVGAEEREMFIDAGCSGCISDPLDTEELAEKIRKWI